MVEFRGGKSLVKILGAEFTQFWLPLLVVVEIAFPSSGFGLILISEVDTDSPGIDRGEFVELYNSGSTVVSFESAGYAVVAFDGSDQRSFALPIFLQGQINPGEYWVIGGSTVSPKNQLLPRNNCFPNENGGVTLVAGLEEGVLLDDTSATFFLEQVTLLDAMVYGKRTVDLAPLSTAFSTTGRPYELDGLLAESLSLQRPVTITDAFLWESGRTYPPTLGQAFPENPTILSLPNLSTLRQMTNNQTIEIESVVQVVSPAGVVGVSNSESSLGSIFLNDSTGGIQLEQLPTIAEAEYPLGAKFQQVTALYSGSQYPQLVQIESTNNLDLVEVLPTEIADPFAVNLEEYNQRFVRFEKIKFQLDNVPFQANLDYSLLNELNDQLPFSFRYTNPQFFVGTNTPKGLTDFQGILLRTSADQFTLIPRFEDDLTFPPNRTVWEIW